MGLWVRVGAVLVGLIALRATSSATGVLAYVLLAAFAFGGRRNAVLALALLCLLTMLNPVFTVESAGLGLMKYLVIACAGVSVALRARQSAQPLRISHASLVTLILGGFFVLHALVVSPYVEVSVLKAIAWTVVVCSLLAAWSGLDEPSRGDLEDAIFSGLVVVVVLSVPLLWMPAGFAVNGTGFQGILNHPQAFGPVAALLGAWTAARFLSQSRPAWRLLLLFALLFYFVMRSEARTAGFAMVLGVAGAILFAPGLAGVARSKMFPGLRSQRLWLLAALGFAALLVGAEQIGAMVTHYVSKSGRAGATGVISAYEASRGGVIDAMVANITRHPFVGIGFGVASDPASMEVARDPVLGLPLGAPVEKGVMPLAVLEEVGVWGAMGVLIWLFMVLRRGAKGGGPAFAVAITALMMNFGESVLFSPGGLGLLPLILLTWAMTCRDRPVAPQGRVYV